MQASNCGARGERNHYNDSDDDKSDDLDKNNPLPQTKNLRLNLIELRTFLSLEAENIKTIGELCRMDSESLTKLRNFGRVTLKEIEKKLTERALRLGMAEEVDAVMANR